VAFSSSTVDGADVVAGIAGAVAGFSSATTDGKDTAAASVSPVNTFSSSVLEGADAGRIVIDVYFVPVGCSVTYQEGADTHITVAEAVVGFTGVCVSGEDRFWNNVTTWSQVDSTQAGAWTAVDDTQAGTWTQIPASQTPGWGDIINNQTPAWTPVDDSQAQNWLPIVT
jgi:hypothetical protein